MLTKKKIIWVTDDCYVDHDIDIVPLISTKYEVHWIILFANKNNRFNENDILKDSDKYPNLYIHFIKSKYRKRNPKNIFFYNKVWELSKTIKPDIFHFDIGVDNPWAIPMFMKLPKDRTIIVLHQGIPHEGMSHRGLCNFLRNIEFHRFKYVKMFSKSQASLFKSLFPQNTVFDFKLPLIGFGQPTNHRPADGVIRFLSFGTLNYAKNIDLLIDAACLLYEMGIRGFKVSINGSCSDWSWYQQRIKYPDVFELDIRKIENSEIPNLFNNAHFFVQPYRVVSQSGPMKIAFNYNLPVIVSNLPGFTDELEEGVNGYSFYKGDVKDLVRVMKYCIDNYADYYDNLRKKMDEYIKRKYSLEVILEDYCKMFESVSKNN